MLADQPDQSHQADLRVDVQSGNPRLHEGKRARDRHRHAEHHHEWIAPRLELPREHEEDQHDREDECVHQRVALLDVLP